MTKTELKDQLADELISRFRAQPDNGFSLTEFERQCILNTLFADKLTDLQYQINELRGLNVVPPKLAERPSYKIETDGC